MTFQGFLDTIYKNKRLIKTVKEHSLDTYIYMALENL